MRFASIVCAMSIVLCSTHGWTDNQSPVINKPYVTIQVGSFKTLKRARNEVSRLKAHGISAIIKPGSVVGNDTWHRVHVGMFDSKIEAKRYERSLIRKGIVRTSWIQQIGKAGKKESAAQLRRQKGQPAKVKQTAKAKQPSKAKQPANVKRTPSGKAAVAQPPSKRAQRQNSQTEKGHKTSSIHPAFSLGMRVGALLSFSASDLEITRTTGTGTRKWEFANGSAIVAVVPSLRLSDRWSIEGAVEQLILAELNMQYLSLGPKWHFKQVGSTNPYLRAALLYSRMDWGDAPGDFDDALGAEIGLGLDIRRTKKFSFGLEAIYRNISFDYNAPADPNVTHTDSNVDFSGLALFGHVRYHF